MDDAYIGEIRIFAFNFVPESWIPCNGQSVAISQYTALYAVIGNQFGGTANNVAFYLPNLNGNVAMGESSSYPAGSEFGMEQAPVDQNSMPAHNHMVQRKGSTNVLTGKVNTPSSTTNIGGTTAVIDPVASKTEAIPTFLNGVAPNTTLALNSISGTGGGVPHENRQPYLKLQYCICVEGVFPTHS